MGYAVSLMSGIKIQETKIKWNGLKMEGSELHALGVCPLIMIYTCIFHHIAPSTCTVYVYLEQLTAA